MQTSISALLVLRQSSYAPAVDCTKHIRASHSDSSSANTDEKFVLKPVSGPINTVPLLNYIRPCDGVFVYNITLGRTSRWQKWEE